MMKYFLLFGLSMGLVACGSGEKIDRSVFEEVNQSMEVKKVNEAEILNKGIEWGNELSQKAQEQLIGQLTKAISEKGTLGALEYCNIQALPILEEVSSLENVTIRRASNDYRNPKDKPTEEEQMILEAYEYNEENNIDSKANVQEINNGEALLYTSPIKIPGKLCLQCHGNIEEDIDSATWDKIQSLYPDDQATGHEIGDLRGMWSIIIPKKELIKKL